MNNKYMTVMIVVLAGCASEVVRQDQPLEQNDSGSTPPMSSDIDSGISDAASPKDVVVDSSISDASKPPVVTLATCLVACEKAHPTGKTLGDAIDACWLEKCSPACTHDMHVNNGNTYSPALDAGSCATDVKTPAQGCSNCTVQSCCGAWDACFTNGDCKALNTCAIDCYSKYSQ